MPIINQPQVAILGVGGVEKRAVVVDDRSASGLTCHLSLGYDHRLIDGADAGRFLSVIKERLENFDDRMACKAARRAPARALYEEALALQQQLVEQRRRA